MTYREFCSAISTRAFSDDVVAYATNELAKLDARVAEKKAVNDSVREAIVTALTSTPKACASEIASACGVSTQKAVSILGRLCADGVATYAVEKVTGRGNVRVYSLVPNEEEAKASTEGEAV